MSKYIKSNTNFTYKIEYIVDGNLVSPASANITLKKNGGTVVGGIDQSALTIGSNQTFSNFVISSGNNIKTLAYEMRFIEVNFVYNSANYTIQDFYVLRDDLSLPLTANDVRTLVGMVESELSDQQIDLYTAYDDVQSEASVSLSDLISSGSVLIRDVRQAVALKAAENALTFLETTLFQSEQSDNTIYSRFANIDFNAMRANLKTKYSLALAKINGKALGTGTSIGGFILNNPTDPITNS